MWHCRNYRSVAKAFDNRRILHSRTQILPTDGERWMQGSLGKRVMSHGGMVEQSRT